MSTARAGFRGALAKSHLRAKVRESIALAVAQENGYDDVFTNSPNLIAGTEIDFPIVRAFDPVAV